MFAVFEGQRSEIGNYDRYGINRVTDSAVIQLRCFGIFLVVARPAGFSLFHFCHRNSRVVFKDNMKNRIMTGRAVVVQVFEVIFMAEGYAAGILGFNMDRLPEISRNDHGKGENNSQQ
jgi:hypothetical protein